MSSRSLLKRKLNELIKEWRDGLPARYEIEATADELLEWKRSHNIPGLWETSPLMITATLDDGLGQGLQIIHRYAELAGLHVKSLGNCQPPEIIIEECTKYVPDLLGLTVLQFTSEDALKQINREIPPQTLFIVGGSSIFQADPDFAVRTGVHFVSKSAVDFIQFLLEFNPERTK